MKSFSRVRWHSPLVFVALLNLVSAEGFTQCYYPDGSIPVDYIWRPCSPGAKNSACCADSDICQENGLCYYAGDLGTGEEIYRGACTDRTFNDPSCNADICVNGFETTWVWTLNCGTASNPNWACGPVDSAHNGATCSAGGATITTNYITTTSTTSAQRYTAPPSVDPNVYTVMTSTYEATISAYDDSITFTTTWQSTFTKKIGEDSAIATDVSAATITAGSGHAGSSGSSSSNSGSGAFETSTAKTAGKVVIGTGVLIAIIAIPVLLIALIGLGVYICLKKRRSKKDDAIRLNSAVGDSPNSYPPPNGPVGADQVYPYEAPVNEAKPQPQQYKPVPGPKVDTYEIDDQNAVLREKYSQQYPQQQQQQGGAGGMTQQWKQEEQRAELSPVTPMRSPAPQYSQVDMNGFAPVELADTSATGGFRFH